MTYLSLSMCRKRINDIDEKILRLLAQRAELALQVARRKHAQNLPIPDAERERDILARLTRLNPGPLSQSAVARLFQAILNESRMLQIEQMEQLEASDTSMAGRESIQ